MASMTAGSGSGGLPPPSRPSTPVVGPLAFGGTAQPSSLSLGAPSGASALAFSSSAKAKLAALTVALPSLSEADGDADDAAALAPTVRVVVAAGQLGRAPAPSPAAAAGPGVLASGGVGTLTAAAADPFGGALSFGAPAAAASVGGLSSRPSSPLFFGGGQGLGSGGGGGLMPSLSLAAEPAPQPRLTFGGGGSEGGNEEERGGPPLAVSVPAVVTVTGAGAVTESKVAPPSPPSSSCDAAGDDALDTIAAQDARLQQPLPFGFPPQQPQLQPHQTPAIQRPSFGGPVPFGVAVADGFVSNDAPASWHQSPQRPPQQPSSWPFPQPPQQQQPRGPTPQQALMMQFAVAQQQRARAQAQAHAQAQALAQHQHQQRQAMARQLFAHHQQQQQVLQQRMAAAPRATAAPAAALDEALVPACNGRCLAGGSNGRGGGLSVLALTRAGSVACARCGQRAYSKLATVDTDPYALSGGERGGSGGGGGGRTPTIPSLSSPPHVATSFAGLSAAALGAPLVPAPVSSARHVVSSYGAVRRAPRHSKPHHHHHRRASASGLSPDTLAGAMMAAAAGDDYSGAGGVDASSLPSSSSRRNPQYNPYLAGADAAAGAGEPTHTSLKSRRTARRQANGGAAGASILPRARVVLVPPRRA